MNSWDGARTGLEDLRDDERLRVLACSIADAFSATDLSALSQVGILPDAVVLESHWLRRSDLRHRLEKCRAVTGESVSGEEFYRQARRAVYLADVLPGRGVEHLHAFRSDAVLCVWLVKKLTGLRSSAAVEESPALGRALLARLLADFERVSNSDKKLAELAGFHARDELELKKPPVHREFRIGPFRLKLRAKSAPQDRRALEREWLEQILKDIHA